MSDILFSPCWGKFWPKGFKIGLFLKQKYTEIFRDVLREDLSRYIYGYFRYFFETSGKIFTGRFYVIFVSRPFSANISVTFQATLNRSAYFINHSFAVLRKVLGEFWAFWERDIFQKG